MLFTDTYIRLYGRTVPNGEIEILNWSVRVETPSLETQKVAEKNKLYKPTPISFRRVFDPLLAEYIVTPVYKREDLKPGAKISGPAIISEEETATVISNQFLAQIDSLGAIDCQYSLNNSLSDNE